MPPEQPNKQAAQGDASTPSSQSEMASSLRLSEARLAGILASAMDAIITVDEGQRVILFNGAAEKMFQCSAGEALGKTLDRFIPSRLRKAHREHIHKFSATQVTQRAMGKLRPLLGLRANGEEFPIEASISQVDAEGNRLFTAIIRDVSEKRRLESQFLRAQRMESIGTLAGGIAHDLNNVLSPILTAVELLRMRFTDESSLRLLNILQTNAIRGSEMMKQVLSFARGVEGDYAPLRASSLIEEIVTILTDTLPKNIKINILKSVDGGSVTGDSTQLHQVLMNLCVNARDAMPQGGELTIESDSVDIDEHYASMNTEAQPGRYVRFSVVDSGIGIDESNLSKIFDPFFTTKAPGLGTGLGLSTVAGIVRSHRGFITVDSEPGQGSRFSVFLPANETAQKLPAGTLPSDLPTGNSELILIVDDESAIREIAEQALSTFGYRVLTASDGTEALALFAENKDDVKCVITDMMMPFLDGPATIRALRKLAPHLKIIATSGLKANSKSAEVAQMGISTFLQKPYTTETLLKAIAAELKGK